MSTDPPRPEIVFLDAGGVLFGTRLGRSARVSAVLQARGIALEEAEGAAAAGDAFARSSFATGSWLTTWQQERDFWRLYYRAVVEHLGSLDADLDEELFYLCHSVMHYELFPEVVAVLDKLAGSYRLGVISNAFPSLSWGLDRLDIRKYFEHIVLSADVGVAKPDHQIYRVALERMGSGAEHAVFVDDLIENVAAGRAIGMQALHLVRDRSDGQGDLKSLDELDQRLVPHRTPS